MKTKLLLPIMLATVLNAGVAAQGTININRDGDTSMMRYGALTLKPEGAISSRSFDYNPRLGELTTINENDTLLLDFFEDKQYKAVITKVTTGFGDVLGITANIINTDFASCLISLSKEGISILADIPSKDEQYRAVGKGEQLILSLYSLSAEQKKQNTSDVVVSPPTKELPTQPFSTKSLSTEELDAPVTIDVMVVYTPLAKNWASQNATSINNVINTAFQQANLVLNNSQTNITLNVVHAHETVDYIDNENIKRGLKMLQDPYDGIMDEVHQLRMRYRADLVVLMQAAGGGGGIAYVPNKDFLSTPYPEWGFSLVDICGDVGYVITHEIAHNFGAGHHWQQIPEAEPGPAVFSYSSAWRGTGSDGELYRSFMAYDGSAFSDGATAILIPYLSNPDITAKGVRIGSIEKENNALTLKQTKHIISQYSEMISPFLVNSDGVLTRYTGISYLGHYGFVGENIIIPDFLEVNAIGVTAFQGISGIRSIYIPSGVTSIGERAFENCTSLSTVVVNTSTPPQLASNAFSGVNKATCTLVVPVGKKHTYQNTPLWEDFGTIVEIFDIENSVLKKYSGIDNHVTIPSGVTAIGNMAFFDNKNIISVTISDEVTSIGSEAFLQCISIKSLSIPSSVRTIGEDAFTAMSHLAEINVASGNPSYTSINGVLFNKNVTKLILYPTLKNETSYTIPNTVQVLEKKAFSANSYLQSVTIPASVTEIQEYVFISNEELNTINVSSENQTFTSLDGVLFNKEKTVLLFRPKGKEDSSYTIPNSVVRIAPMALYNNYYLESINIPNSVTSIGECAFQSCYWLSEVAIPNSTITIEKQAFDDCHGLASVIIPNSVTSIGEYAFSNCRELKDITVDWGRPLRIHSNTFIGVNTSACTLYIPQGTKSFYKEADVWKMFGTIIEKANTTNTESVLNQTELFFANNIMHLNTPTSELISIYSVSGSILYQYVKPVGTITIDINSIPRGFLIIKGSSGWVKKVNFSNVHR